jgi:putative ABC transport system permease protein
METTPVIRGTIQKQVHLPMSKAVQIAFQSIRVRKFRAAVTATGIFLGIAFLASTLAQWIVSQHTVVVTSGMDEAMAQQAQASVGARQIWLVTMSLLVCLVGITNSMLMAVTERYREIGTMKCLGALDSFVVRLFLIEAGLMGVIASILGWVIGFWLTALVLWARTGPTFWTQLPPNQVMISFIGCVVIGLVITVIAAILPAYNAAKLPPVAALRVEV